MQRNTIGTLQVDTQWQSWFNHVVRGMLAGTISTSVSARQGGSPTSVSSNESQHQFPLSPQTCETITCFKKQKQTHQTHPCPAGPVQRIPRNHCFYVKLGISRAFPVSVCSSSWEPMQVQWNRRWAGQGELSAGLRFEIILNYLSSPCSLSLWVYKRGQGLTYSHPKIKVIIVMSLATVPCLQSEIKSKNQDFLWKLKWISAVLGSTLWCQRQNH